MVLDRTWTLVHLFTSKSHKPLSLSCVFSLGPDIISSLLEKFFDQFCWLSGLPFGWVVLFFSADEVILLPGIMKLFEKEIKCCQFPLWSSSTWKQLKVFFWVNVCHGSDENGEIVQGFLHCLYTQTLLKLEVGYYSILLTFYLISPSQMIFGYVQWF